MRKTDDSVTMHLDTKSKEPVTADSHRETETLMSRTRRSLVALLAALALALTGGVLTSTGSAAVTAGHSGCC